jgi:hypothetical protein
VNASKRLTLFVICTLILTIGCSTLPAFAGPAKLAVKSAPIVLVRDHNGNPVASVSNQMTSENWSGYVLSKVETGDHYTSASSTWVVPEVTFLGVEAVSLNWVGIGGFCKGKKCRKPDNTLIQLGTLQAAVSDTETDYIAWYELIPGSIIQINQLEVNPGDVITASLSCAGKCKNKQKWTLSLEDVTTSQSWSQLFTYKSSKLSVDYIEEAPTGNKGILPLADYGTTFFSASVANGDSANLDDAIGVVMEDTDGSSLPCAEAPNCQTSNVSAPNATLDGFVACFSPDSTLAEPCVDTSP